MHLHLTESSARPGMQVTAEAEREYWMSRQKAAVKAPAEIDVHAFHDALGLMYPLNWSTSDNGVWETFMLQESLRACLTQDSHCFRPVTRAWWRRHARVFFWMTLVKTG